MKNLNNSVETRVMPDGRIYKVIGNDKSGAYGVTAEARRLDLWIEQQRATTRSEP